MHLPHGYICASLGSRRPKDFGNQIRIKLEVRRRTRPFLLSPSSVGNEQGQQMMRIQFLILGEVWKLEI